MGKYTIQELTLDVLVRGDAYEQSLLVDGDFDMADVTEVRAQYTIGKSDSLPRLPFAVERDGQQVVLRIAPSQSRKISVDCQYDVEFFIGGLPYTVVRGTVPVKLDVTR